MHVSREQRAREPYAAVKKQPMQCLTILDTTFNCASKFFSMLHCSDHEEFVVFFDEDVDQISQVVEERTVREQLTEGIGVARI